MEKTGFYSSIRKYKIRPQEEMVQHIDRVSDHTERENCSDQLVVEHTQRSLPIKCGISSANTWVFNSCPFFHSLNGVVNHLLR